MDRRRFLNVAAGSGVALAALPLLGERAEAVAGTRGGPTEGGDPAKGVIKGIGPGGTMMLDGQHAGWFYSQEGGTAVGQVVLEPPGADLHQRKHIGGVKYEDITVTCGTGMSRQFYQWIKDSFDHKYSRKNGAIIAADFDHKEHSRRNFTDALITETRMPALDAASKDVAFMTITIDPEVTGRSPANAGQPLPAPRTNVQKLWTPANFRLRIDGLDDACKKVNKIEALVVKQKVVENPGQVPVEPTMLEIPNLVITLPEAEGRRVFPETNNFYEWHEDFVIRGNNGQDKERGGTLEYLTPDLREVLFPLRFYNLGVFKLTPEQEGEGGERVRRIKVEMYCEDMRFSFGNAALG